MTVGNDIEKDEEREDGKGVRRVRSSKWKSYQGYPGTFAQTKEPATNGV